MKQNVDNINENDKHTDYTEDKYEYSNKINTLQTNNIKNDTNSKL